MKLEQAKEVTKLRQEVEQGAKELASKYERKMKVFLYLRPSPFTLHRSPFTLHLSPFTLHTRRFPTPLQALFRRSLLTYAAAYAMGLLHTDSLAC